MKNFLIIALLTLFSLPILAQMAPPKVQPTDEKVELFNRSALSMTAIKDVKTTDSYYQTLATLTEKYGVVSVYDDATFRPNQPLTRIQFAVFLNRSLDRLNEFAATNSSADNDDEFIEFFQRFPANNSNDINMGKVKDISPDFAYFQELQSLYERYGINIGDADNKFRPNQQMTEKEFYSEMGTIFAVDYNRKFSATKTVSRGEFAYSLAKALDLTVDVINKAKKKSADAKLSAKIKSLPSKGKAKIVKYLLAYLPDNTCVDLKSVSREIEIAAYKGGVWGDYKIKNDDIGDIVFEADNTCKKGEKLVLLRVGTAIVTISEKGIKRIK